MKRAVCRYIREWIDSLRKDLYAAVSMERFLQMLNGFLEDVGEEGVEPPITREDVLACLKRDKAIKIVSSKDGKEVLMLWDVDDLIDKIIEAAAREGEAAVLEGVW
jgi:hypothetical protein